MSLLLKLFTPHTAPISYQHTYCTNWISYGTYVRTYECTFKVTFRYFLPIKTYSEPFILSPQPIHSSSSSHTCHPSSTPTVAARLLLLLSTGTFPLPPCLHPPTSLPLHPPTSPPPDTHPPPLLSLHTHM